MSYGRYGGGYGGGWGGGGGGSGYGSGGGSSYGRGGYGGGGYSRDRGDGYGSGGSGRDHFRGDRGWGRPRGDAGRGGWGGSGGRGGGGRGGFKRGFGGGGRSGGPPSKHRKSDHNWEEADRHPLMQSLFMESIPEDFETDWLFVVCPPGKRRLLVGARDVTEAYNSAGAPELAFQSCLPSGSQRLTEVHKVDDLTILDTVYSPEKKRFYIVDLLHWKHYPYYDTEAEFRFFVLPTKYSELRNPTKQEEMNEYPLELLEKYPCSAAKIEEILKAVTFKVEGLLFIKKDSLYVTKDSEDVLWLKLDKMEKVLGLKVPEGVQFAHTNSRDEKRRVEQEERKKLKAERMAARAKEAADRARREQEAAARAAEEEEKGSGDNGGEEETEQEVDGGD